MGHWLLGLCYEGSELRCEERINHEYGYDTVVPVGVHVTFPKKDWPRARLQDFIVFPGYVFIEFPRIVFDVPTFKARTRIQDFIHNSDGNYLEISSDVIYELNRRQASREFSNWRYQAVEYFKKAIGRTIRLPSDHRFPGARVVVENVVGDNVHWRFSLLGSVTQGTIKAAKLWPKDRNAQTLALSSELTLYGAAPPDEAAPALRLPAPPGGNVG